MVSFRGTVNPDPMAAANATSNNNELEQPSPSSMAEQQESPQLKEEVHEDTSISSSSASDEDDMTASKESAATSSDEAVEAHKNKSSLPSRLSSSSLALLVVPQDNRDVANGRRSLEMRTDSSKLLLNDNDSGDIDIETVVDVDEVAKQIARAGSVTSVKRTASVKGQAENKKDDLVKQAYPNSSTSYVAPTQSQHHQAQGGLEAEALAQIEPLPSPAVQQNPGPGAYAVVGPIPGQQHRLHQQQQQQQEQSRVSEASIASDDEHISLQYNEGCQPRFDLDSPMSSVTGGGLAVATVVDEEEGMVKDIQKAESLPELMKKKSKETKANTWRIWSYCFLYAVLAIALLVTLLVVFVGGDKGANGSDELLSGSASSPISPAMTVTAPPTAPPTTALHGYVTSLLPDYSLEALSSSLSSYDDESPQAIALEWLLADPSLLDYPEWRVVQRFALATFYYSTGGDTHWTLSHDWLSYTVHECFWFSRGAVSFSDDPINEFFNLFENPCEDLSSNVTRDNLSSDIEKDQFKHFWLFQNNMTGTFPTEITLLTGLRSISIFLNNLEGTIDTRLGQLTNMEHFAVAFNALTGTIPSELGQLSSLRKVGVFNNRLTGTIPSQLGGLSSLWYLFLENNMLTGTLPREIFNRTQTMKKFFMDSNQLTGSIPDTIGQASSLREFDASRNMFSSTLPTQIGQLSPSLQQLYVKHTMLSGTIPTEVGLLSSAMLMDLSFNMMTGTIPSEIGLLSGTLDVFEASNNKLQGTLPAAELNLLADSKIFHFIVSDNQLTGSIEQINITSFATFNATGNVHLDLTQDSTTSVSSSGLCWVDTARDCSLGDSTVAKPHCLCDCAC